MKLTLRVNGTRVGDAIRPVNAASVAVGDPARPKRLGLRINRGALGRTLDSRLADGAAEPPTAPGTDLTAS